MNRILVSRVVLWVVVLAAATAVSAQSLTTPPGGGNQRSVVTQYMGMVSVTVDDNSPDVTSPAGAQMQNLETQIARLKKGEDINP